MTEQVKTCSICGGPHGAKGLCLKHYKQMRGRIYYQAHKEQSREKGLRWRQKNRERSRELSRANHQRHKEKRNAESRAYREANQERMRDLRNAWWRNNPVKVRLANAARRIAKFKATPEWARSEFEQFAIEEMYDLAVRRTKATGIPWQVDHIVPLRSKLVCGLHCVANLRVIPAMENHRKGNRTWPNHPNTETPKGPG